ncbi:MAG TPA: hypothetical protein VLA34_06055 [Candidatus Krumholzibacterium sp.]|nr:hypothetical protein [Candidatus Krumholzibacterium sp.]
MKVIFYQSEKVFEKWPDEYWKELEDKLKERGHGVQVVDDEMPEEFVWDSIRGADAYVGPVGELYELAGQHGKKRVAFLGATFKGEGVRTKLTCGACLDKIVPTPNDCFFEDELCMREIPPNDILEVLCGL